MKKIWMLVLSFFLAMAVNSEAALTYTDVYTDAGGWANPSGSLYGWGYAEVDGEGVGGSKCIKSNYHVTSWYDGGAININNWGGDGTGKNLNEYDFIEVSYKITGPATLLMFFMDADGVAAHMAGGIDTSTTSGGIVVGYSNGAQTTYKTVRIPIQAFTGPGSYGIDDVKNIAFNLSGVESGSGTVWIDNIRVAKGTEDFETSTNTRICIIGDSITESREGTEGCKSFRYNLWQKLTNSGYKKIDFVGVHKGVYTSRTDWMGYTGHGQGIPCQTDYDQDSEGWWGFPVDYLGNALPAHMTFYTPDIAMIHLGHNDLYWQMILKGQTAAEAIAMTTNELRYMVRNLRLKNPNVKVVIGQVIRMSSGNENLDTYRALIPILAKALSNAASPVISWDFNSGMDPTFLYDGTHPNPTGEQTMATNYYNALVRLLPPLPSTGIGISAVSVSPSSFTNTAAHLITLNATAVDSNGSITGVTADLSSVGGSATYALSSANGTNWSATYNVASGISHGVKTITFKATDNSGNTRSLSTSITVYPPPGTLDETLVYVDAGGLVGANFWGATEVTTGGPIEGTKHLYKSYNVTTYWDGFGLCVNGWAAGPTAGIDFSQYDFLEISYKLSGPAGLYLALADAYTNGGQRTAGGASTAGKIYVGYSNSSYKTVRIPINAFKWNSSPAGVTNVQQILISLSGLSNATGEVYVDNIKLLKGSEAFTTSSNTRIVCIGDSITEGIEGTPGTVSYRRTLWHLITNNGFKTVDFVGSLNGCWPLSPPNNGPAMHGTGTPDFVDYDMDHEGWVGYPAEYLANAISAHMNSYTPDIALIHLGHNDEMGWHDSVDSTTNDIAKLVDNLRFKNPNIKIVLGQIILPSSDPSGWYADYRARLASLATRLNTAGSPVIAWDINTHMGTAGENLHDGTHPSVEGENIMATNFYNALLTWLPAPAGSGLSLSSVTVTPSSISNNQAHVITLNATAIDSNGSITGVVANLSSVGGSTSFPLTNIGGNNWRGSYTVAAWVTPGVKSLGLTATDDTSHTINQSVSLTVLDGSKGISLTSVAVNPLSITNNAARIITVTATASDTNGTISGLSVNLSAVGGSSGFPMTNIGGNNWRASYTVASGYAVGTKTLTVRAMDDAGNSSSNTALLNILSTTPIGISIMSPSVTPTNILNNVPNIITISVVASDSNGSITGVTANLSPVGGSASFSLANTGGNNWSGTYTVAAGVSIGVKTIYITATDDSTFSRSISDTITVVDGANGISMTGLVMSPAVLTNNKDRLLTVSLTVADSNGTISGVTADLSSIGGSSAQAMSSTGGGGYQVSYLVDSSSLSAGSYALSIRATDNSGNTRTLTTNIRVVAEALKLNTFQISPNPLILSGSKQNGTEFKILYSAKAGADVAFEVYTILGETVIQLTDETGSGEIIWDGKNDKGVQIVSGVYLLFMRVNGQKMESPVKFGLLR